jgi:hypothetical protein
MCIATWNSPKIAMKSDAALLRSWRNTAYTAGPVTARIGRRDAALDRLLHELGTRSGGFVTAWNPLARRMPTGWNGRMMRRLDEYARRLPRKAGRGVGRNWWEEHVLLGADPRRVIALARRFRQRGVVIVAVGQAPRLVVLEQIQPG